MEKDKKNKVNTKNEVLNIPNTDKDQELSADEYVSAEEWESEAGTESDEQLNLALKEYGEKEIHDQHRKEKGKEKILEPAFDALLPPELKEQYAREIEAQNEAIRQGQSTYQSKKPEEDLHRSNNASQPAQAMIHQVAENIEAEQDAIIFKNNFKNLPSTRLEQVLSKITLRDNSVGFVNDFQVQKVANMGKTLVTVPIAKLDSEYPPSSSVYIPRVALYDNSQLVQNVSEHLSSSVWIGQVEEHPSEATVQMRERQERLKQGVQLTSIPSRNELFTGRERELMQLCSGLQADNMVAVCSAVTLPYKSTHLAVSGMGGIGKSQLIKEYAHRCRVGQQNYPAYQLIRWMNATEKQDLEASYISLAKALGLSTDKKEAKEIIDDVHQVLAEGKLLKGGWLLIYDNARPETLLEGKDAWLSLGLPTRYDGIGHILITSRSSHWQQGHTLQLGSFTPEEAFTYLKKLLPDAQYSPAEREMLAKLLGYHPLALTQAGGYIKHHRPKITIMKYMDLFTAKRRQFLDKSSVNRSELDAYKGTVWTTVNLSVDAIKRLSTQAKDAASLAMLSLQMGCFLAPGFAPTLLYDLYGGEQHYDVDSELSEALQLLEHYGLANIEDREELPGIVLHEVVQYVTEDGLAPEQQQSIFQDVIQLFTSACDGQHIPHTAFTHQFWFTLLPHANKLVAKGIIMSSSLALEFRINLQRSLETLCVTVCSRCYAIGSHQEQEYYAAKALDLSQELYGQIHQNIAQNLHNLGLTNAALDRDYKAIGYYEQSLQMLRQSNAPNSLCAEWAKTLYALGASWLKLSEKSKAIQYYEQALAIQLQIYGTNVAHKEIAVVLWGLGTAWSSLGELHKTIGYYEQALVMHKQFEGKDADNAAIALILQSLGQAWYILGQKDKAIEYYKQARAMQDQVYGNNTAHRTIAQTLTNLGLAYARAGEKQRAIKCHEEALEKLYQLYGRNTMHIDIGNALNNFGTAWLSLGEKDKALSCYEEALMVLQQIDSKSISIYIEMARILNNIGAIYSNRGEKQKAHEYYEQALTILPQLSERDRTDLDRAQILRSLGNAMADIQNPSQAMECYERALSIQRCYYQEENADIAKTFYCIAHLQVKRGNYQEALTLCEDSVILLGMHLPEQDLQFQAVQKLITGTKAAIKLVQMISQKIETLTPNVILIYQKLLSKSPWCTAHYHNFAYYVHMLAEKEGDERRKNLLITQADILFKTAVEVQECTSTLLEYGQFLYLCDKKEESRVYLTKAITYPTDGSLLSYSIEEIATIIPALQQEIVKSLSIGQEQGAITLKPKVLAYALLSSIALWQERKDATASSTGQSSKAKEYLRQLQREAQQHPSPVHYGLLAHACEEVGEHNLARKSAQYSERLWQARQLVAEEKQTIWKEHFVEHLHAQALAAFQNSWCHKVHAKWEASDLSL